MPWSTASGTQRDEADRANWESRYQEWYAPGYNAYKASYTAYAPSYGAMMPIAMEA